MNFGSSFPFTVLAFVLAPVSAACSSSKVSEPPQVLAPEGGGNTAHDGAARPDANDHQFPNYFSGQVEGTDARVGIVGLDYRTFRLFFCGGAESVGELTHWFNTNTPGPAADGFDWTGRIEPDGASGELIAPGGKRHPFVASPVEWGGLPNLYEATAPCGKVGVIVSPVPGSDEVHVQGACTGAVLADAKQVNPILPLTRAADGSIQVRVEGEADIVVMKPVSR